MEDSMIIDGHLDLSMNAMDWNRDIRMSVEEIRASEKGMTDHRDRGNNVVSFSAMKEGNIAICMATLIARYAKPTHPLGGWRSPEQAWAHTEAQLAWYSEMEREGHLFQIATGEDLAEHIGDWKQGDRDAIGYLLTLEGADSIITLDHLEIRKGDGLIAIGPAHYGPGTYAYGTNSDGPLPEVGKDLLREMDRLGIVLDVTHLSDTCFWEALDIYKGTVWASHNNCRSLVNHNRQFSDDMIKALIERDAVIGMALDAWMLVPDWEKGVSHPSSTDVTLQDGLRHLDHICQIAGNANHVAIGTDLDGGFGAEQCPSDIETIADIKKVGPLLENMGYGNKDIEKVKSGNWYRKFMEVLIKEF